MGSSFAFWFDGIFLCTVSLIGNVMNILAISVLWTNRNKMKKLFHKLIISLFCADCAVLLTSMLWNLRWSLGLKAEWLTVLYPYFILPFNHIGMTVSIFLTLTIAHERYQALSNPTVEIQQTERLPLQVRRLLMYVVPIISFSFLFNIPKFLELKVIYAPREVHKNIKSKEAEGTATTNFIENIQDSTGMLSTLNDKALVPEIYISDFLIKNQYYLAHYYWACVVILGIIPLLVMTYLIFAILRTFRQQSYDLTNTSDEESSISLQNRNREDELSAAKMTIAIAVVFLICHGIRTFVQIFIGSCELIDTCNGAGWHPIMLSLNNFFIILKSSINIIIYCFVCKRFRRKCTEKANDWINAIALNEIWRTDIQVNNTMII